MLSLCRISWYASAHEASCAIPIFYSEAFISDHKLALAKEFGADVTINVKNTTPEERIALIKKETNGRGADIVCECVGRPEAFPEGLRYLRKAGMHLEPGNFVECGEAKDRNTAYTMPSNR